MHLRSIITLTFTIISLVGFGQSVSDKKADSVYTYTADAMPAYNGGEEALRKFMSAKLHYPEKALAKKVEGDVLVSFIVTESGECTNFKVKQGIGKGCDEEAVRVLKEMPRWQPAKIKGKPVQATAQIPVSFRITKKLQLEDNSRTKNQFR